MHLFIDTETTGLSRHQDHVVQVAWMLTDDAGMIESEECRVVQPSGYSIPHSAAQIHGITTAIAREIGQPLRMVLERLALAASRASILVAHNLQFDLGILESDYKRAGLQFPFHGKAQFCTMRLATAWCRLPKGHGSPGFKYPRLQELHYRLFNRTFAGAHDARADARACMRCYFRLLELGVIDRPPASAVVEPPAVTLTNLSPENRRRVSAVLVRMFRASAELGRVEFEAAANRIAEQLVVATGKELELDKKMLREAYDAATQFAPIEPKPASSGHATAQPNSRIAQLQWFAASADHALRLIAAGADDCPEALLVELVVDVDAEVREAVLRNPATSEQVLTAAVSGESEPDEDAIALVAAHPNCAVELFQEWIDDVLEERFDKHAEIGAAMAGNPACPTPVLFELWWSDDDEWIHVLRGNPSFALGDFDSLLERRIDANVDDTIWLLEKSDCPVRHLEEYSTDKEWSMRALVARNPNTPPAILLAMSTAYAGDTHSVSVACVGREYEADEQIADAEPHLIPTIVSYHAQRNPANPMFKFLHHAVESTPQERDTAIRWLAKFKDAEVRVNVAQRNDVDGAVLAVLAADEDVEVRLAVAKNFYCPREVFVVLTNDKSSAVRIAVGENRHCSIAALKVLMASPFHEYRELVARHASCTADMFRTMATDPDLGVREAVVANNACPMEIRAPLDMAIAGTPNCSDNSTVDGESDYVAGRVGDADSVEEEERELRMAAIVTRRVLSIPAPPPYGENEDGYL